MLGFAWWLVGFQVSRCAKVFLAGRNLFSLFLVGSVGNVSAVFVAVVSHGMGTKPAGVRGFRICPPDGVWALRMQFASIYTVYTLAFNSRGRIDNWGFLTTVRMAMAAASPGSTTETTSLVRRV